MKHKTTQVAEEESHEVAPYHFTSMAMKYPLAGVAGLAILAAVFYGSLLQEPLDNLWSLLCMTVLMIPTIFLIGFFVMSSVDVVDNGIQVNYMFRASNHISWEEISEVKVRLGYSDGSMVVIKYLRGSDLAERIPVDNNGWFGGINRKAKEFVAYIADRAKLTQKVTTRNGGIIYRKA
jgi:hypothetical protein